MKKWFFAQFPNEAEIISFMNRHGLGPGELVVTWCSDSLPMGMIRAIYYAESELK